MPTYEYHCEKCHKDFEVFQSMKDASLRTCPKDLCRQKTWGKGKVRRLLGTGAGVIFKGSGFYTTDYRSSSYKEAAKKETGGGGGSESSAGEKKTGDSSASGKSKSVKKD